MGWDMSSLKALHEVLETFSNPLRLEIFLSLAEKGSATYSELVPLAERHGVKPSILAYHLRRLRRSLLILKDEGDRYRLSEKGRTVLRGLNTLSEAAPSEKKQWLQDYEEHARITPTLIHSLLNSLGIPSYALPKVAGRVYGLIQSLPLQTIPYSLIQSIITTTLIEHGLCDYLAGGLQLGLTVSRIDRSSSNPRLSRPLLDQEILSKVYLEYFLHRYLPREVGDAHYMGRICLEDGGDPFSPSRIFLAYPQGESATNPLALTLSQLFQGLPGEVVIQDPLLTLFRDGSLGEEAFWNIIDFSLGRGMRVTLSFSFPTNTSPTSQEGYKALSQVQASIKAMAEMKGGAEAAWIYRLPSSLLFVQDYMEALKGLLEVASSHGGRFLFVNDTIPWMRGCLIGRDGSRVPLEGGGIHIVAASASINMPILAYEAKGNRSFFKESVLNAMEMAVQYFLQKRALLANSSLAPIIGDHEDIKIFHHLNLYSLESLPRILVDARFPSGEASSLLLDLIKELKEDLSVLSQENDLRILPSSVMVPSQVSSLFKRFLPEDIRSQGLERIDPETDEDDLIHAEVILQKFLNGGFTPLSHISMNKSTPRHEYLLNLFSRREIGILPLQPFPY
jgi:DNA-binding transcriptional ArsR family regulator